MKTAREFPPESEAVQQLLRDVADLEEFVSDYVTDLDGRLQGLDRPLTGAKLRFAASLFTFKLRQYHAVLSGRVFENTAPSEQWSQQDLLPAANTPTQKRIESHV